MCTLGTPALFGIHYCRPMATIGTEGPSFTPFTPAAHGSIEILFDVRIMSDESTLVAAYRGPALTMNML